jgi:glycosyltransferase involved in cell wall biosynthesis
VDHGKDIVLADDPQSFAAAVVRLLRDRELRSRYEQAAAAKAAQFDWSGIGDKFARVLEAVVLNTPREAAQYAHS